MSDSVPLYRSWRAPAIAFVWLWCCSFEFSAAPSACGAGLGTVGTAICAGVAVAAETESWRPCIFIPANNPMSIAAPAIVGSQMRTRSPFHSCKSASIVFARLSRERSSRLLASSIVIRRFLLVVLAFFGAAALVLSTLGIYRLVSFIAASRTREIGIRIALGATKGNIDKLIVSEGLLLRREGFTPRTWPPGGDSGSRAASTPSCPGSVGPRWWLRAKPPSWPSV